MKSLSFLFIFFIHLNIFGQSEFPKLTCEEFDYSTTSNTRMHVNFISLERYLEYDKDTIKTEIAHLNEDPELNKIFQKKYPDRITKHCINSKFHEQDSIRNISFCDEKMQIKLIAKKSNFYIFKIDAFEIDNYLLFNINNELVFTMNNYPKILENGKIVIDSGYEYGGNNAINYYVFGEEKVKYFEFRVPAYYRMKKIKILKSFNSDPKIIGAFFRYGYKGVHNSKVSGKEYIYDEEQFCRKFVMLSHK